jgi:restriction endonuclease S subunit
VFSQRGEGWEEKRLGDPSLLQIIDGDRGEKYPKKSDFFDQGYCLFLNTKNVRPDGFSFETKMFISKEKDEQLRKGKLRRRDVVLTTRGTIGNIALYDDNVKYDNIRINSGMLIFRPNEEVITSEYLFEILRSSIVKSQIASLTSGAAQPQLPISTLVNFVIPVPCCLNDQRILVSNLRKIYSETLKLEILFFKKQKKLIDLKQSILQKAFTGELTSKHLDKLDLSNPSPNYQAEVRV